MTQKQLDLANKNLSEIMINLQELFLKNHCPILPPELPEPMEGELFTGMPVFNEPIGQTQITFGETMTHNELNSRINEIKQNIYQIAEKIGIAQFSDLYTLSHKKISKNISAFRHLFLPNKFQKKFSSQRFYYFKS